MCGYSAGSGNVQKKRTRDNITKDRANAAYDVEDAQQRFNDLDRELREFDLNAEAERIAARELNAKLDDLETKGGAA